jgi:hypothetical protein
MQADSWLMSTKLDRYVAYFKSFMGVYERGPKDATFSMGDPSRGRNSVPSQQSLAPGHRPAGGMPPPAAVLSAALACVA